MNYPGTRHLIYHLYPVCGSNWRWNFYQLERRRELFNGRIILAVATGPETVDFEYVKSQYLFRLGPNLDLFEISNCSKMRERNSWDELWSRLSIRRPLNSDYVFYAHSKGTTRGGATEIWARIMYSACLDFWPRVAKQLDDFLITGCCRKIGVAWPDAPTPWHYSGTFFWTRWRDGIDRAPLCREHGWGVEMWSGDTFQLNQSGVLVGQGYHPWYDLYRPEVVAQLEREFDAWSK